MQKQSKNWPGVQYPVKEVWWEKTALPDTYCCFKPVNEIVVHSNAAFWPCCRDPWWCWWVFEGHHTAVAQKTGHHAKLCQKPSCSRWTQQRPSHLSSQCDVGLASDNNIWKTINKCLFLQQTLRWSVSTAVIICYVLVHIKYPWFVKVELKAQLSCSVWN